MLGFGNHNSDNLPATQHDVEPLARLERARAENLAAASAAHDQRQAGLQTLEAAGVPRVDSQARHDLNTGETPVIRNDASDSDTSQAA